MNYELRVTNYELGKAHVLCIFGIRNVKFNTAKTLIVVLTEIWIIVQKEDLSLAMTDIKIAGAILQFS